MDSLYAVDANKRVFVCSLTALKNNFKSKLLERSKTLFHQNKNERIILKKDISTSQKIMKISLFTLLSIGIIELILGYTSGSVVAIASGLNSFAIAMISSIALIRLHITTRPPNNKFQYGYEKVEVFAALVVAIGMILFGMLIMYNSYTSVTSPHEITQPFITMLILFTAGTISILEILLIKNLANKYNLLYIKLNAKNLLKSGTVTFFALFSMVLSTQIGFLQIDALSGLMIAAYIFYVSYLTLKKSSLKLVDVCEDSTLSDKLKKWIMVRFNHEILYVKSISIRPTGMALHAEIHIVIDGKKRFGDVDLLLTDIETVVRSKFSNFASLTIVPHSEIMYNEKINTPSTEIINPIILNTQ